MKLRTGDRVRLFCHDYTLVAPQPGGFLCDIQLSSGKGQPRRGFIYSDVLAGGTLISSAEGPFPPRDLEEGGGA